MLAVTYVFILEIGSYPELNLPSSSCCSALVASSLRKRTPTSYLRVERSNWRWQQDVKFSTDSVLFSTESAQTLYEPSALGVSPSQCRGTAETIISQRPGVI